MKTDSTLQNKQGSRAINSIGGNIAPYQIPNKSKHQIFHKKRFSKTKLKYILSGFGLLLLVIGGVSALFLSKTNQDIRQQASADPLKVDLTLNPNHLSAQKNQAVDIPLVFDTKNATLTAADVRLDFNPALIKINSIAKSDLSLELSAPQIKSNYVTFTFAASLDSGGIKGTGTLAVINAELLQENKGSIVIGDATQIAIKDSTENELGDKTSHDLEYNGGNHASPSPTSNPTPSSSPSPTPTSNPQASPSPTPSSSPSPTPTSNPQASPSPSPTNDLVVCTQDAKQCPDGSWVGRTGPSCEFVCPDSNGANNDQDNNQNSTIKSCNQACSSSEECEVNHFCYSGYCRLVDNPASTTCSTTNDDTTNNNVDASDNYNDKNYTNNTHQLTVITTPNCNDPCTSHSDCHDSLSCFNGNCRIMTNPKSPTCNPDANINVISVDSQLDEETPVPIFEPLPTSKPTTPTYKPTSTYTPKPYVPSTSHQPVEKKETTSFFEKIIEFFTNLFN